VTSKLKRGQVRLTTSEQNHAVTAKNQVRK